MKSPKISVITVCYNAVSDIEDTILSVLNQDYNNIEYIIIDGESIDGTLEILKKYQNNIAILISEKDEGIYHAMNKGVANATGEWVIFLNAGDGFFKRNALHEIFNQQIPPNIDVIYGDTCLKLDNRYYFIKASPLSEIKERLPFCHQSAFVRSIYLKHFQFNLNYSVASDYHFFYTIYLKNIETFLYNPQIVSFYNTDTGYSIKNTLLCLKEQALINNYYSTLALKLKFNFICFKAFINKSLPYKIIEAKRKRFIRNKFEKVDMQIFYCKN